MKIMNTLILVFLTLTLIGQETFTISGHIKDISSGETLIGANIYNPENTLQGTVSNIYGFYSLTLPKGKYKIKYSYLGFSDQIIDIDLSENIKRNIELGAGIELEEVVVTSEKKDKNVTSTEMGTIKLQMEDIKKLPALFGEVDVLKSIQLLPGVSSAGEGNAGFYVRGGGADQNLVLLDEAVVYNSGHMFGFFSVFNADALKNTTLIKGNAPAKYGGRLSSVLDIQMKEGNKKSYGSAGGVGIISSRLMVEGPIKKDQSSFIVTGRRTYLVDLIQPFLKGKSLEGTNYYFYDLNTKVNHKISDKDHLYASGYFGRDVLIFKSSEGNFSFRMPYGNTTATLRWNHIFSDKLFLNTSIIYNDYNFEFNAAQEDFNLKVQSGVKDWNGKLDWEYYANPKHTLNWGANYIYHTLSPNNGTAEDGENTIETNQQSKYGHEAALYLSDNYIVNAHFSLEMGLRASGFSQVGPYVSTVDGKEYDNFEKVKTYTALEPRLNVNYSINKQNSIKGGVSFNTQYLHLVSSSTSSLPTDIWVPSTERIKPQKSIQYALGYFKNFDNNEYETSVEVYYKDMFNQLAYSEEYVQNGGEDLEDEFVSGIGRGYGLELFVKKKKGKFNGWLGYTLSKSERKFDRISNGSWFPAIFDRTHDISLAANYQFNKKWEMSSVFIYGTGNAYTPIQGVYFVNNDPVIHYAKHNSGRRPAYHRIDFSMIYTPKPENIKKFKSYWIFSVYNAYNKKNQFFDYVSFETGEDGTITTEATKVTLFPIIPSIAWNFKFNQ